MYDQDIIEKKPSSPVTTALLAVGCAALIGAMILQGMRIKKYSDVPGATSPTTAAKRWADKNSRAIDTEVKKILAQSD